MRRSFGGGRGMGGGGGMIRTVQRTVRAGVGGASAEPFSPSANTTTVASANSRKARNFNTKQQPTSANAAALTLAPSSSSSAANNNNNNNNNNNSSSSSKNGTSAFSSLMINLPISAASGATAPSYSWESSSSPTNNCSDESEWECVDGSEDERGVAFYQDYVFGTVPSTDEVHHAVSALQRVLAPSSCIHSPKARYAEVTDKDVAADKVGNPFCFEEIISSAEAEKDWVEPLPHLCDSKMLQHHGTDRVYDAFHLLETEPSVQRMVISLSSDKAVWDAVLNNEVVKELRGSICQKADSLIEESSDKGSDDSNPAKDILNWILKNGRAKIMQLIDKITKIMNEAFRAPNEEKKRDSRDPLEEKLKTSLFLSVLVLLMVVITRTKTA